jgi:hypothetical protein
MKWCRLGDLGTLGLARSVLLRHTQNTNTLLVSRKYDFELEKKRKQQLGVNVQRRLQPV